MDFRTQVAEEKKRLSQQRRDTEKRIGALESELSALATEMKGIDAELAAIDAYESATAAPAPRKRRAPKADARAPAKRTRRRRRASRRAEIVAAIASFGAAGAGRADIIRTLDVKGDKSAEQSVSNALAALKKSGEVTHQDGKYMAQAVEGAMPAPAEAVAESEAPTEAAAESEAPAEAAAAPEAAPKARRRRGTSRRAVIVSVIEAAGSDGIGRAGIIEQLNVKGDKSAEQSVSNALANLKKSGAVAHGDGKYSKPA